MTKKVSVDLSVSTPYIESRSWIHRNKRRLTYSFAFRLLNKYLRSRSDLDVLEIGTGSGFFLDFAEKKFPRSLFTGIEFDQRLIAESSWRAPHANIVQGNAESFNVGVNHFDLVVSFQVIEHLYDPGAMLKNVRKHLKPGGIFLVTTPNLGGLGARIMKENWHGFREDHVSLRRKDEWDRLIQSYDFIPLYSGSTFFTGIPMLNRFPLGIINWLLLLICGSLPWPFGEAYVGVFKRY